MEAKFYDVTFDITEKDEEESKELIKVKAHRFVLATKSPYFNQLFNTSPYNN